MSQPQADLHPVEAVLFDYGQVLSGPPSPAAWARIGEIMRLSPERLHDAYWTPRLDYDRGTHSGAAYWHAAATHAGTSLTDSQLEALLQADTDLWTQPNQPMIDWAHRLQAAGIRTGILSNLGDVMTAGVLATFPWLAGFDFCLWSHTVGLTKPEARIYALAAEGLRTGPAHILFVDDREDNIASAAAAGMQTIRYVEQAQFERDLRARGLETLWLRGHMP